MEKYTLILFIMPIILLSVVIALAFITQRLTSIVKTPIPRAITVFILYMVYAYSTLQFSYSLLGFYSYTFVIETAMAYYFFPKYGHWVFLATPSLTALYYYATNYSLGYEEIQIAILGACLFVFALVIKRFSQLETVVKVCFSFTFKWLIIAIFPSIFSDTYSTVLDSTLIYFGSLLIALILWGFYRIHLTEQAEIKKVIQQGQTDALTGVYNFQKLGTDLQNYETSKQAYALAMIDLDYFKQLNDTFGHHAGNDILKEFAALLTTSLETYIGIENFSIYRFGGEEFCVLFFDCSTEQASKYLTFFKNVYETRHRLLREANYAVTFSVGIESNENHQYNGMETMQYADEALYEAKYAGRNQIHMYQKKHQ